MSADLPRVLDALRPVQGRALPDGGSADRGFSAHTSAGTLLTGQIIGQSGQLSLVRIRGQDFLMQLPQRWPTALRQLSLVYLGGEEEAKFLLLQPQGTSSSAATSLSPLLRTLFAAAPASAPATLALVGANSGGQILASSLAASLQSGVESSGMFYESHLQAWAQGNYPSQRLLQEPQGKLSPLLHSDMANGGAEALSSLSPAPFRLAQAQQALGVYAQVAAQGSSAFTVPAALHPVLQQQGQVLMQQQLLWNVAVWPGQNATWKVSRRHEDAQDGKVLAVEELSSWESRLEMDLPSLGHLDARMRLRGDNLSLRMQVSSQILKSLHAKLEELRSALELLGLQANIRLEAENG